MICVLLSINKVLTKINKEGNILPMSEEETQEMTIDLNIGGSFVADKLNSIVKRLKKDLPPPAQREYFRKKYQVPHTHYDPRLYSAMEVMTLIGAGQEKVFRDGKNEWILRGRRDASTLNNFGIVQDPNIGVQIVEDMGFNASVIDSAHREMSRFEYPTYFIDEQTLQMLDKSGIADGVNLDDVIFPMPSMQIVLPKGAWCLEGEGEELACLSITRTFEVRNTYSGEYVFNEAFNDELSARSEPWADVEPSLMSGKVMPWTFNPSKQQIIPNLMIVGVLNNGASLVSKYPLTGNNMEAVIEKHRELFYADEFLQESYRQVGEERGREAQLEAQKTDVDELTKIVGLAVKMLCFMAMKKDEWVNTEKVVKPARYKKGKLREEELWSPNFLGRKFGDSLRDKGYGERGERDGRKQRYHWRQGHFKGVRYGKGRTKTRIVFVEPYCVNPPE